MRHNVDDLQKRLMETWFDLTSNIIDATIDQWQDHLRSCVCAGGGHFKHLLWNECSFMLFVRTFYETVNVI